MLIDLKKLEMGGEETVAVKLIDRLPRHISSEPLVQTKIYAKKESNFYLLKVHGTSNFTVTCQRCLNDFPYFYDKMTEFAVCDNEDLAERLMDNYECLVSPRGEIALVELLTDELHLYVPEAHPDVADCDSSLTYMIQLESEKDK